MWQRIKCVMLRRCGFNRRDLKYIREVGPLWNWRLKCDVYYEMRGDKGVYVVDPLQFRGLVS